MPKQLIAMGRNGRSPCAVLSDRVQAKHAVERLVIAFLVIMVDKLLNDLPKVTFPERYDTRETLPVC